MKPKLLLGLALVLSGGLSVSAHLVHSWSAAELMTASDLVVVATPLVTKDLDETNSLEWPTGEFRGVETTFKVFDVVKGMSANDLIILHHYRFDARGGFLPSGPDLVNFPQDSTNKLMLYLIKDGTNRYAPVTGQVDSSFSIRPPPTDPPSKFGMPSVPLVAGQTNPLPLYVHYGFVGNDSAQRFLSARIHLDEAIFVGGDDFLELKGQVERHGAYLVADLVGSTGPQSQFYQGNLTLEKPFFAQGGAASGGAGPPFWFVISTNWDCRAVLKNVNAVLGLTGDPFDHLPTDLNLPTVMTNHPTQFGRVTNNMFVDPLTGLPLSPKRDNQSFKKQLFDILTECQKIKPGMTRAELLKTFTTEGGLSSARHRTFAYRGCPYIKVDVEFTFPEPGQAALEERPGDIVSNISKPYLEWSIND